MPPTDPFYRRGCASVPRGRVLTLGVAAAGFGRPRLAKKPSHFHHEAASAWLAARRSHNPEVASVILTSSSIAAPLPRCLPDSVDCRGELG